MKRLLLKALAIVSLATPNFAQTKIELIKDIEPGVAGGVLFKDRTQYLAIGNTFYFAGTTSAAGQELWKSDGTDAGTVLVKDINVGAAGSTPTNFNAMGGKLYFVADDGAKGRELWVSDGTSDGTRLVKDITVGSNSAFVEKSFFNPMVVWKNRLYFKAASEVSQSSVLYVSDGTTAGTKAFRPAGVTTDFIRNVSAFSATDSVLYLIGYMDSAFGEELLKTNGTPEGTKMVYDIYNGFGGCQVDYIYNNGKKLYFFAESKNPSGIGSIGKEPWESDGSATGTKLIADINPNGDCTTGFLRSDLQMIDFQGKIFFSATDGPSSNQALWATNGNQPGVTKISNDNEGYGTLYNQLTVFNDRLYYFNGSNKNDLSSTDGKETATVLSSSYIQNIAKTNQIIEYNEHLYISSEDDFLGYGEFLEQSKDSTITSLSGKVPNYLSINGMHKVGGSLFVALKTSDLGYELYRLTNPTSTAEIATSPLAIYPNPTKDGSFSFNSEEVGTVCVYNAVGTMVFAQSFDSVGLQQVRTNNLPQGLYVVEYCTKNTNFIGKLIVD